MQAAITYSNYAMYNNNNNKRFTAFCPGL